MREATTYSFAFKGKMLIGENLLFGLLFYGSILWLAGLVIVVTFVLTLIYAATYYDRSETTGARSWTWFRRLVCWDRCRRRYRHEVHHAEFDSSERREVPCLFAATPHGVNAVSFFLTFMALTEDLQKKLGEREIECGVWNGFSWLPILRELTLALGCVNVERQTIVSALRDRRAHFAEIPNGVHEIAPPAPPVPRTGFLRLVYELEGAADCALVYLENEEKAYLTLGDHWSIRRWAIKIIGFPITPYAGPLRTRPLRVWIGPRHVYREGESYEDYKRRWFDDVAAFKARVHDTSDEGTKKID
jgi:hypothetical protein